MSSKFHVYVGPMALCTRQADTLGRGDIQMQYMKREDLWSPNRDDTEEPDADLWLPNREGVGVILEDGPGQLLQPGPLEMAGQIAKLRTEYASPLQSLERAYGVENVTIVWGILSYWI